MTATSRSNSRRNLLLIAAIAFVPMFIAYGVFFFAPELIPQNTTNRGQLMSPPVDLTGKLPVTEDWQLVLVPRSACANDCTDLIHQTRQIHIALGKNADRVSRSVIFSAPISGEINAQLEDAYPELSILINPQIMEVFRLSQPENSSSPFVVYVVDPLGQLVMAYDVETVGKPLLLDLKHLLKVSSIG